MMCSRRSPPMANGVAVGLVDSGVGRLPLESQTWRCPMRLSDGVMKSLTRWSMPMALRSSPPSRRDVGMVVRWCGDRATEVHRGCCTPGFELRRYDKHAVAEVNVYNSHEKAGKRTFRTLVGYIGGLNHNGHPYPLGSVIVILSTSSYHLVEL